MDEYVLTKHDEVLLLNKNFKYEPFGTLWGTSRNGDHWCCDPSMPGEYLQLACAAVRPGLLCAFRTMTRQEFEELFA